MSMTEPHPTSATRLVCDHCGAVATSLGLCNTCGRGYVRRLKAAAEPARRFVATRPEGVGLAPHRVLGLPRPRRLR
jgi:hypothetical protein